jgi:hypothetical protein
MNKTNDCREYLFGVSHPQFQHRQSNVPKNKVNFLFLHISAELRHLQGLNKYCYIDSMMMADFRRNM